MVHSIFTKLYINSNDDTRNVVIDVVQRDTRILY